MASVPAAVSVDSAGLYAVVRLVRRFEQRAIDLVRSGVIVGGVHPYLGQEAVAAGVCGALRADDVLTSTHRGHGHVLAKGADPGRVLAELAGRESGLNRGRGGSMHAADLALGIYGANAIVGAGVPIAAGAAWAGARKGSDRVVAAFFGDGAANQGVVLETFNLAALWQLPLIFVCENNGWATSTRTRDATAGSITARAAGFGIAAQEVDGQDPQAVYQAAAGAVARARAGGGPSLLECVTSRFDAHHTFEHAARPRYRTEEELAAARARDPLAIQGARIPEQARARIDAQIEDRLEQAERFALAAAHPDPAGAGHYLYAGATRTRTGTGTGAPG
jgi:TPP-dependent pyruvate/acetoin dehydrogenase alpha subunit